MRLSELKTGEKAIISKVKGHGGFRKRIVEMGFLRNKEVVAVQNAPLEDPVKYLVMGYNVSLRRREADLVVVTKMPTKSPATAPALQGAAATRLPEGVATASPGGRNMPPAAGQTTAGKHIKVVLVGNPNSGKTSLFNIASGAHERVGNYAGVTVNAREGKCRYKDYHLHLVDLPGTYSMTTYSLEEMYVRKYLTEETPDVVINVIDASNLERNLYLTTQLVDMKIPVVGALNIYDELEKNGAQLDYEQLGQLMGVPMVPTASKYGRGVEQLLDTVVALYEDVHSASHVRRCRWGEQDIFHGELIEDAISNLCREIWRGDFVSTIYPARFLAIKLLEEDEDITLTVQRLSNGKEILALRDELVRHIEAHEGKNSTEQPLVTGQQIEEEGEDVVSIMADAKYDYISHLLQQTYNGGEKQTHHRTDRIDRILAHKVWGFPIFFLLMYITFQLTFTLGQYPMNWIEWLVDGLDAFVDKQMPEGMLKELVVGGAIPGVGGVIVFLPNILILYLCISIMEDSGYMARAAFIMDKMMHKIGLHGKSFIPLVMGFGCNVPAVLSTRTIEDRKVRLITMLVNPLISCSARLPVYLMLVGTFFPHSSGAVLFSLYFIGIVLVVVMAKLFSLFLRRGEHTPFIMELPPYRFPTTRSILRHTWEKGVVYLKKMGGIILTASIIVWFLSNFPRHGQDITPAQQQESSYLGMIGRAIEPVMEPLGFDWRMSVGLLAGTSAKEIVVSTLGVLYATDEAEPSHIAEKMPITPLVAYCYMLFVLIYFPCVATIVAIKQESGSWRWALFAACYSTALAWLVAWLVHALWPVLMGVLPGVGGV